ncbi:MAG: hypothetical protein E6J54_09930 [Deltaproteobacteria bacterium]|nr:MAG: hypothetical protein E6J54_09930 [Deltaproteobacteria bacterium]
MEQPSSKQPQWEKQSAAKEHGSLRCCCGSLLARLVPQGVELKCRRCKRQVILPLEERMTKQIAGRSS